MEYRPLQKGSGYLYEHHKQLYKRVKTDGESKYLKCVVVGCDGSAKLVRDQFFVRVSVLASCKRHYVTVSTVGYCWGIHDGSVYVHCVSKKLAPLRQVGINSVIFQIQKQSEIYVL